MEDITDSARRRQRYQRLLETGSGINDSIDGEDLLRTLSKVQDLVKEVDGEEGVLEGEDGNNPADVVMDIQVLKMNHELIAKSIKTKGTSNFHDDEFINALKEFLLDSNGTWLWESMAPVVAEQMKVASNRGYPMLGTFGDILPEKEKVTKQRVQRSRKNQVEEKKPEKVTKVNQEMNSTQKINDIYKQVLKIYEERSRRGIPFFELVCHPDDFMLTVENLFQMSFLCREGLLALSDNKEDAGFPIVKPLTKKKDDRIVKDTVQAVSTIDYDFWKKCILKYRIRKPLLQLRDSR